MKCFIKINIEVLWAVAAVVLGSGYVHWDIGYITTIGEWTQIGRAAFALFTLGWVAVVVKAVCSGKQNVPARPPIGGYQPKQPAPPQEPMQRPRPSDVKPPMSE